MKWKHKEKQEFWAGLVNNKIHFYGNDLYYDGVFHADLFRRKTEAKKVYEEVVRVTVERVRQPGKRGTR